MERNMILPRYVEYNHIRDIHVTLGLICSQKQENIFFSSLFITRRDLLLPVKKTKIVIVITKVFNYMVY